MGRAAHSQDSYYHLVGIEQCTGRERNYLIHECKKKKKLLNTSPLGVVCFLVNILTF